VEQTSVDTVNFQSRVVQLNFSEVPQIIAEPVPYDDSWELREDQVVNSVGNIGQVTVKIFRGEETQVFIILEDEHGFYDPSLYLEGGPDQIETFAQDMNNDGQKELLITVEMGNTYKIFYVYSFDGENWVRLLATENLMSVDLNNDAKDELITTSIGSFPGYVYIFRWNGTSFEKADVTENTENIYASIVSHKGRNYIETGKADEPGYYEYSYESLTEVDLGKL
jgi:hypothetical protein